MKYLLFFFLQASALAKCATVATREAAEAGSKTAVREAEEAAARKAAASAEREGAESVIQGEGSGMSSSFSAPAARVTYYLTRELNAEDPNISYDSTSNTITIDNTK